jgi:hypothetical protein
LTAAVGVVIQSKPTDLEVTCPTEVTKAVDTKKHDNEFYCSAKVYTGSNMKASMDFKDGKTHDIFIAGKRFQLGFGPSSSVLRI